MEIINSRQSDVNKIVDLTRPILVSMESFQALTDAKVVSDDGLVWHVTLMAFDVLSRNSNLYPADDTKRSFDESTYVQENLHNRTWFGEAEHPPADAPLSRFLFVEPTRYAWNIMNYKDMGDRYEGDICLCPPLGTDIVLKNVKLLGSNYASSCRIYTPNFIEKTSGPYGHHFIKKYKMYPVTFDCVTMPGIKTCRLVDSAVYQPGKVNKEALGAESTNAIVFANPAEAIKDMMKSTEALKVLSDYIGTDLSKSTCIVGKNQVRYQTEDGIGVNVPLNQHLVSSILS